MIRIVRGDFAHTEAEAIMRPVTAEWTAVTPAMRRLEMQAGTGPADQCRQLGELPVGSAIITGAGDLPVQFMIHVVVRSLDEPVTPSGVRRGVQNGVRRLIEWGVHRVAVVPFGTGAGNLDAEESAAIMVPEFASWLAGDGSRARVDIHVDSDYEQDVFERHVRVLELTGN